MKPFIRGAMTRRRPAPATARRSSDRKAARRRFIHPCCVCGGHAMLGFGVNLREGKLGWSSRYRSVATDHHRRSALPGAAGRSLPVSRSAPASTSRHARASWARPFARSAPIRIAPADGSAMSMVSAAPCPTDLPTSSSVTSLMRNFFSPLMLSHRWSVMLISPTRCIRIRRRVEYEQTALRQGHVAVNSARSH